MPVVNLKRPRHHVRFIGDNFYVPVVSLKQPRYHARFIDDNLLLD